MVRELLGKPLPKDFDSLPEHNTPNPNTPTEETKGADMNPIWKEKIFSRRPEYDDPDLRYELEDIMRRKNYHPTIVDVYRIRERSCILERREYVKDIKATQVQNTIASRLSNNR